MTGPRALRYHGAMTPDAENSPPVPRWQRLLFTVLGLACLALGLVGIVVPLLPTTPFLLAASFCFWRGSARLHRWLDRHPWLGPRLRRFREHGLSRPEKVRVWAVAFGLILLSAVLIDSWHVRAFLALVVVAKTIVLWRMRTAEPRS